MTQRDRDRLVALKKARKGLITQKQAAEEIGQSERHVRRLLKRLKGKGDGALHALRGCRIEPQAGRGYQADRRRWRYSAAMSIGALGRRWQRSTWPANTTFTQGGRRCERG